MKVTICVTNRPDPPAVLAWTLIGKLSAIRAAEVPMAPAAPDAEAVRDLAAA
jgi:hypothetical protein